MPRITNRTVPHTVLWTFTFVSLAALIGCASKVKMEPPANFLLNGTYRSKFETAPGNMTGLYLQLNGNGRFSMSTLKGGCLVTENWGVWNATQEELSLAVQKSSSRETCNTPWQTVDQGMAFHCSMRNVTDRSFQMLHDEIQQGTVWTAWERESAQGSARIQRLRREQAHDVVTLNAGPDADEGSDEAAPGKTPASVLPNP
ncbi:MAG: hypothetical protein ABIW76_24490 [Fibrobacteria bacterium]